MKKERIKSEGPGSSPFVPPYDSPSMIPPIIPPLDATPPPQPPPQARSSATSYTIVPGGLPRKRKSKASVAGLVPLGPEERSYRDTPYPPNPRLSPVFSPITPPAVINMPPSPTTVSSATHSPPVIVPGLPQSRDSPSEESDLGASDSEPPTPNPSRPRTTSVGWGGSWGYDKWTPPKKPTVPPPTNSWGVASWGVGKNAPPPATSWGSTSWGLGSWDTVGTVPPPVPPPPVPPPVTPWNGGSTIPPPTTSWGVIPRDTGSNVPRPTVSGGSESYTLPSSTSWDPGARTLLPPSHSKRKVRIKSKPQSQPERQDSSGWSNTLWAGATPYDPPTPDGWQPVSVPETGYPTWSGGWGTNIGTGGVQPPMQPSVLPPVVRVPDLPPRQDAYRFDQPSWNSWDYSGPVLDPSFLKATEARLTINPLLAPMLESEPQKVYLEWNMLFPSDTVQRSSDFAHIGWSNGKYDLATFPRLSQLNIACENYPWVIEVNALLDPGVGVTCGDVINAIATDLWKLASKESYDALSKPRQKSVLEAYTFNRSNAGNAPGRELGSSMRRMDFLEKMSGFGGIVADQELLKKTCGEGVAGCVVMKCKEPKSVVVQEEPKPAVAKAEDRNLLVQVTNGKNELAVNGDTVGMGMQMQMTCSPRLLRLIEGFVGIILVLVIGKLSRYL